MEIIKQLKDYYGYYVSNVGNVYSYKNNKLKKLKPWKSKIKRPKERGDYLKISLSINGIVIKHYIHRLVAKAFIPNQKEQINHKNGIKNDNKVENLEWVTSKENHVHAKLSKLNSAFIKQQQPKKLTKDKVINIKKLLKEGLSQYKIAGIYNVSRGTICDIKLGRIWKNPL